MQPSPLFCYLVIYSNKIHKYFLKTIYCLILQRPQRIQLSFHTFDTPECMESENLISNVRMIKIPKCCKCPTSLFQLMLIVQRLLILNSRRIFLAQENAFLSCKVRQHSFLQLRGEPFLQAYRLLFPSDLQILFPSVLKILQSHSLFFHEAYKIPIF